MTRIYGEGGDQLVFEGELADRVKLSAGGSSAVVVCSDGTVFEVLPAPVAWRFTVVREGYARGRVEAFHGTGPGSDQLTLDSGVSWADVYGYGTGGLLALERVTAEAPRIRTPLPAGQTVRDYFAAGAPDVLAWFEPEYPPKPKEPMLPAGLDAGLEHEVLMADDASEEARALGLIADVDLRERVLEWFSLRAEYGRELRAHRLGYDLARLTQWRWRFADAMMEGR